MEQELTSQERAEAYAEVTAKFGLRHQRRDQLDVSPLYLPILRAAHAGQWTEVAELLVRAEILEG